MVNFVFRWCIASSFIFHFLKCFTILFIHFIGTFNLFQNYHFLPEYSMSEFLFSPPLWTKYNSVSFSLLPSASLVSCIFRNYFYSCRTSSCHYPKSTKMVAADASFFLPYPFIQVSFYRCPPEISMFEYSFLIIHIQKRQPQKTTFTLKINC